MVDGAGSGRVCVLYTGGTIGTRFLHPDLHRDEPMMMAADEIHRLMIERSGLEVPFDFQPLRGADDGPFTPVVSSGILPTDWVTMAETILDHYDDYDGFVVLHGTDTMAWTASALSFMFENLRKPVVLTGSQRPIAAAPSDAVSNFVSSVMLAARAADSVPLVAEVVICFGDLVLRGNRSTKVSAASLQGFDTPNCPRLGRVGRRFEIDGEQLRLPPEGEGTCVARTRLESAVADVILYPGMPAAALRGVLTKTRGAVLRTFGAGNAPGGRDVQRVLREAADAGTVMVNVTQTNEGMVEAGMLSGSRALSDCGVLSGLDLTAEAALTKLMVLLGSEMPDVVADQMQLDQRGEQSMDLVELHASSRSGDGDGICRLVLSRALQARARPNRLTSAVLRLRATVDAADTHRRQVDLHLNHWWADRTVNDDRRRLGRVTSGHRTAPDWDAVLDVTEACRGLLRTGAPVTLTAVPSSGTALAGYEAVLSLFMERIITDEH